MIFVTVGSMMPFDRLIRAMDLWASKNRDVEAFAQIGEGAFVPRHMRWERTITPREFKAAIVRSEVVVAHAGMGTIISAAEAGKPAVIMPRFASAKEHTTDHQVHTAERLRNHQGIYVAMSNEELPDRIERALEAKDYAIGTLPTTAPAAFVARIRSFLLDGAGAKS